MPEGNDPPAEGTTTGNGEGEQQGSESQAATSQDGGSGSQRTVPESDLMAVKEQAKKSQDRVKELESELESKGQEVSSWQSQYQDAEAQLKTLKEQADQTKTVQQELDELKSKSESDSKTLEDTNKQVLDLKKELIKTRYPDLDESKYKDMDGTQLDSLMTALEIVNPAQGARTQFDGGDGSGSGQPQDAMSVAQRELESIRKG